MEHATLNDVVSELQRIHAVLWQTHNTQQTILHLVQNIAESGDPYTIEEFGAWREQFERDVHQSPAIDQRMRNALISAASFEKARIYFLDYSGNLLPFREWVDIVARNPNRVQHIPGFGNRSIQKLADHYSAGE